MSSRATVLIARRSIRARLGRLIAISIAILVGVSFVVGSFVLADSLRKTFDDLFTQISQNVDLRVRSSVAFGDDDVQVQRDPIPAVAARRPSSGVDGVAATEPLLQRYAQIVDPDGEVVTTQGAPTLGVGVDRQRGARRASTIKEGAAADGHRPGRHRQGDGRPRGHRRRRPDPGDHRHRHRTRSRSPRSSASATATASPAPRSPRGTSPTAQQVIGAGDQFDGIDIQLAEGADPADGARPASRRCCPQGTEVVDRETIIEESKAGARPDHQRLRHRPAGLRLRHGVRQRLPHQQRVPDHDRPAAARAGADAGRRRPRQARSAG